ncbi:hypothetical protein H9P43_001791 [Blastocladiella emersonii ATCC 22665]|nr:hypothetical protein H9P43_001791 [Blastocladiella emersonii ATCC 22665]
MSPIPDPGSIKHPFNDPTRQNWAFGKRAVPKLVEESTAADHDLKLQALHSLTCRLHDQLDVSEALATPLIDSVKGSMAHPQALIRARAAEILALLTEQEEGRVQAIAKGTLPVVMDRFTDTDTATRTFAYKTPVNLTQWEHLVPQVFASAPTLVDALLANVAPQSKHDFSILTLLLTTLQQLVTHGGVPVVTHALDRDIVKTLTAFLRTLTGGVAARTQALLALAAVCTHVCRLPAVLPACQRGGVIAVVLAAVESDPAPAVRAAALEVMAALSIHVDAKKELVKAGAAELLMRVLGNGGEEGQDVYVLIHALSAVSSLAEDAGARYTFQDAIQLLEDLKAHPDPLVAKTATTATQVVTWRS